MYVCKVINKVLKTITTATTVNTSSGSSSTSTTTSNTGLSLSEYQQVADEVISGQWGGGDDRKSRLEAAGYNYAAVMTLVNHELLGTAIDTSYFESATPGSDTGEIGESISGSAESYTVTSSKNELVDEEYVFHYPPANSKSMLLLSGRINDEMNRAGTFEFQVPPSNTCLTAGYFKKLSSTIEVYWDYDTEPLFRGRIIDSQRAFAGSMTFNCEGWLSVLNDSIVDPSKFSGMGDEENGITTTPAAMFSSLISVHNGQVGEGKKLTAVPRGYSGEQVHFPWPSYEKTFEYIQSNFLSNEAVGGRMWTRRTRVNGKLTDYVYLDADTEANQVTSKQSIIFGKSLLDLTESINAAEIYTVMIPTGKDGLKLSEGYIENAEGISKYGRIWHHEEFNDIEDEATLRTKATEMLARNAGEITSIEVSAVDIHLLDSNTPNLKVGEYVPVLSPVHGIDVAYICTAASIDICNPANTKYTLGVNPETLTTKQLRLSQQIAQSSLSYKSESTSYPIEAENINSQIDIQSISFYRTGKTVYLSFTMKVLTLIAADSNIRLFTYSTVNNPTTEVTSTAYDQTSKKNYTSRSYGGNVQLINDTDIAANDIISSTLTWLTR